MGSQNENISRRTFGLGVAATGGALAVGAAQAGAAQAAGSLGGPVDARSSSVYNLIADDAKVGVHPLERLATLQTSLTIRGEKRDLIAKGARVCKNIQVVHNEITEKVTYNQESIVTIFQADDSPFGPFTVVQDPAIQGVGFTHLSKHEDGKFGFPGLSYFNQHLIFMVGGRYFYYPRAWQVVAAVNSWPPEGAQYHHLEEDTPVFDYVTGEPNVARKGASTITIGRKPNQAEHDHWMRVYNDAVAEIQSLPSTRLQPNPMTPAQG